MYEILLDCATTDLIKVLYTSPIKTQTDNLCSKMSITSDRKSGPHMHAIFHNTTGDEFLSPEKWF